MALTGTIRRSDGIDGGRIVVVTRRLENTYAADDTDYISGLVQVLRDLDSDEFVAIAHDAPHLIPKHYGALRALDLPHLDVAEAELRDAHPADVLKWAYERYLAAETVEA
jgi:hypothetical protein